eukprot:9710937-Lingulodinium_polyedra.AAC.1
MKANSASTALAGAIEDVGQVYDAPTWRRQHGLAVKSFTQVATALQPEAPDAAAEEGAPSAKLRC